LQATRLPLQAEELCSLRCLLFKVEQRINVRIRIQKTRRAGIPELEAQQTNRRIPKSFA
jgi:hypothetical protein